MPASAFTLYGANKSVLNIADLLTPVIKLAILTSAYTPNITSSGHSVWADVSAAELPNGNGYTSGGVELLDKAAIPRTNGFSFTSAAPAPWVGAGTGLPAHRFYVMYVVGSLWGKANPLIGYFLGDNIPANIPLTPVGVPRIVAPGANGWFDAV